MNPRITGQLLVALQFALIAAVAVPALPPFLASSAGTGPRLAMVSGMP